MKDKVTERGSIELCFNGCTVQSYYPPDGVNLPTNTLRERVRLTPAGRRAGAGAGVGVHAVRARRCLCDGSRRSVLRSGVRPVRPLVRIGRSNEFSVSASGRGGNARQPWRVLFGFSAAESCSGVVFRSWQARRIWVGIAELEADNLSRHPHEIADGPHSPVVL